MSCSSVFFVLRQCDLSCRCQPQKSFSEIITLFQKRESRAKPQYGKEKLFFLKYTAPTFAACRCPEKHLFSATTFCRCKTSRKGQKTYEMCSGNSIRLFADTLPFFVSNQVRWLTIQKLAERFKIIPRHAFFFA